MNGITEDKAREIARTEILTFLRHWLYAYTVVVLGALVAVGAYTVVRYVTQ